MLHRWVTKGEPALVTKLLLALEQFSFRVRISNNEDIELTSLLAEFGHLPVTNHFLWNISQSIPSAWRFIGRFLGLSHTQLERVWHDNRGEPSSEISYQMLLKWTRESDQACVNYKCLVKAIFLVHHLDSSSVCDAWSYTRRYLEQFRTGGHQQ